MIEIKVLDRGFVRFIEDWGRGEAGVAEAGIVEAARQSTQGAFRGWEKDKGLLRFLYSNNPKHATPFEFAGMVIEVQAPIFVFREWHRHRTQSYNEMSARYAPLPDAAYLPEAQALYDRSASALLSKNQQERGARAALRLAPFDSFEAWLASQAQMYAAFEAHYQVGLSMGIPKEAARIGMPVGRYSKMRASATLRNWLAFLTLRMDPGAQWEIRQFAEAVGSIIAERFPVTHALFDAER